MHRALILAGFVAAPIFSSALSAAVLTAPRADTRKVEIVTKDDLKLAGTFYEPKKSGQLSPAALLVHDAGGNRMEMDYVAERLQKSGFFVLTFDLRGHGQSAAPDKSWVQLDEAGRQSLWAFAPRDVEAAANWLLEQDGVHKTNLSLVGFGSGCALAVRHASRDENVRCVGLMDPKPKELGFDVASDILEIEGTPTFVVTNKGLRSTTERMAQEANAVTEPYPYVEVVFCSPKIERSIEDKKAASKMVKWLRDTVIPKKGR